MAQIRKSHKDYTIEQLAEEVEAGKLIMPEFQRVYEPKRMAGYTDRLIELGGDYQSIIINRPPDGSPGTIIDGQHRVRRATEDLYKNELLADITLAVTETYFPVDIAKEEYVRLNNGKPLTSTQRDVALDIDISLDSNIRQLITNKMSYGLGVLIVRQLDLLPYSPFHKKFGPAGKALLTHANMKATLVTKKGGKGAIKVGDTIEGMTVKEQIDDIINYWTAFIDVFQPDVDSIGRQNAYIVFTEVGVAVMMELYQTLRQNGRTRVVSIDRYRAFFEDCAEYGLTTDFFLKASHPGVHARSGRPVLGRALEDIIRSAITQFKN